MGELLEEQPQPDDGAVPKSDNDDKAEGTNGGEGSGVGPANGQNSRQQLSESLLKEKVIKLKDLLEKDPTASKLLKAKDMEFISLQRFVRARDGDIDAAFEQMLQVLKWRSTHKVDLILERDYEFAAQERWGMAYWHGRDIHNRPILVIRGCRHDPTLFKTAVTQRYLIWKLESKLMENDVDSVVLILDLVNVTRHNLDMTLVRTMTRLLLNFYPERLGICMVYPTPPSIWMLFKAACASKRLDERTERKFVFVREQKRDNKFLRLVDPDQLQTRFGGNDTSDYGTDGLSIISPAELANELELSSSGNMSSRVGTAGAADQQPTMSELEDELECLGPSAFEDRNHDDTSMAILDPDAAVREHRGSLFREDEIGQMIDSRDDDLDRFQLGLRYQVSHFNLDSGSDADTTSLGTGASPRSNVVGYPDHNPSRMRSVSSDIGSNSSSGRKRQKVRRFLRRHILRKFDTEALATAAASDPTNAGQMAASSERTAAQAVEHAKSFDVIEQSVVGDDDSATTRSPVTNVVRRSLSMKTPPLKRRASIKSGSSGKKNNASPGSPRIGSIVKRTSQRLSPRRSLRKSASSGGASPPTSTNLMDEVKFVMEAGASMKKVARDDPERVPNTWCPLAAERFVTRSGPEYKKNKLKSPSGTAVYECVCCDVWTLASKRPHVASYMQLPQRELKPPANRPDLAPIPELLVVNMMLPSYMPNALGKKRIDGPGQSVVLFAKISDWAKQNIEDPSVQLWSRFVHAFDGDPFRERLKMVTRLENLEELDLGWRTKSLVPRFNGVPWLVRPEYEFHKGRGYFEIDIDYHLFKYPILYSAVPLLEKITNCILDCCLMVQAESDAEMPERVLVAVTIRDLTLSAAPEIDLVQMDNSKEKRLLSRQATSFIDRDGTLHALTGASSSKNRYSAGNLDANKLAEAAKHVADALGGGAVVPQQPTQNGAAVAVSASGHNNAASSKTRASFMTNKIILAVLVVAIVAALFADWPAITHFLQSFKLYQ